MIKFIHKRHMHLGGDQKKMVIYYNAWDIFLGLTLLALTAFFIHDYLSHAFSPSCSNENLYTNKTFIRNPVVKP